MGHETPIPPEIGYKKVTIASMSGVSKFNTFRIKGVVQGKRGKMLINGGVYHNFTDISMVERRHLSIV